MSFAKDKSRIFNNTYSQKLLDHATNAFTIASKRTIQKIAEATSDFTGNKIANKITRSSKTSPQNHLEINEETLREKYISLELKQKIIV